MVQFINENRNSLNIYAKEYIRKYGFMYIYAF